MVGLVGRVEPRIFTPPLRELTPETSWGFDIIEFARDKIREPLTPWQEWLAIHAFELLPPELVREMYPDQPHLWGAEVPRFKTVLLMVARQNGKTHFAKTVIKWALFRKRMKSILGAAQTKQDAWKLWQEILDDCRATPPLRKRLGKVTEKNGLETIRNRHGGQYTIEGLDRGSGRGMTVNLLFMDEMREHKTWDGYSALSSTTLSPVGAMNLLASNAGDYRSVVLKSIRDGAHKALADGNDDVSVGIFEWSADPALDIDDRLGWVQANPDLGHGRLTERDIHAEREAKTEDQFRTENLCQWVDELGDDREPLLDLAVWKRSFESRPEIADPESLALAVDVSWSGEEVGIVMAAPLKGGKVFLSLNPLREFEREETVETVNRAVRQNDPFAVFIETTGERSTLAYPLQAAGLELTTMTRVNAAKASSMLRVMFREGRIVHDGSKRWEEALNASEWKEFSGGVERIVGSPVMVAASFAVWGLQQHAAEVSALPPVRNLKRSHGAPAVVRRSSQAGEMSF